MSKFENNFEDLRQCSWIPHSSEEQLSLGLELINFAYTKSHATFEEEIALLNGKIKELSAKLREAEDKASESDLVLQDLTEKNAKLLEENQHLTLSLRKLKVENTRLQSLTNHIKSTIDANDTQQTTLPLTYEKLETSQRIGKPTEDNVSHNSNRAQQLINQIEHSLQQNNHTAKLSSIPRTNYASKDGFENMLTPGRAMDVGKRILLPKSSTRVSKISRNYNGGEHTQEFKNPLNEVYKSKINEFKKSEVTGFEAMLKPDKSTLQYEEGKYFFREARKVLPFDKFNSFLREIKLLNKGQKSREEVLKTAELLFTKENAKMLETFKQLLLTSKGNDQFLN
eukprot:TRINITY_DN6784_c0_g1_i15.p1 TRINITY_DN6784_c0_g1~~TRINITY_DN6784_c0_g1_i15.p1  ORF type:complete len:340 (-),score=119.61 TRINITY_DN6784_c0_g1_i15:112-1131(-)